MGHAPPEAWPTPSASTASQPAAGAAAPATRTPTALEQELELARLKLERAQLETAKLESQLEAASQHIFRSSEDSSRLEKAMAQLIELQVQRESQDKGGAGGLSRADRENLKLVADLAKMAPKFDGN